MNGFDFFIVGFFLLGSFVWGAWHARRAGQSQEQFFAAGRTLPWWIAGTSIVATTFAADTPLAISGLIATEGISGNWFWWADVIPAVMGALLVAHLWRRSGVLTDNELIELRYGGRPAAFLRLFRALYWGVLRNAVVIGWVNLAMLRVIELVFNLDPQAGMRVLAGLFVLTVGYTLLSGLLGVVLTDLVQFSLAMGGALLLAVLVVVDSGGMAGLLARVEAVHGAHVASRTLALIPPDRDAFWAFVIYVAVKSWSSGNTEGNGYIAQRLLATKNERHARLAALWYVVANFALRPWPWIVVGLFAFVTYPEIENPESGYVRVMLEQLPLGVRGLMLASLFAAFMSTIDTQLNWGASYLTHDVYARFLHPGAGERSLVFVARASVVLIAALGVCATGFMSSISGAWKFLASITAGTGLIVLLRWFWWRINAWSEISVMAASLISASALMLWTNLRVPFSLAIVVAVAVPFSLFVTWITPAEAPERLRSFYLKVQPKGFWRPVSDALGRPARTLGRGPVFDVVLAVVGVYALVLGTGAILLGRGWTGSSATVLGGAALWVVVTSRSR